jgi:putative protein kinase ArgK-like GTPase of G3E family
MAEKDWAYVAKDVITTVEREFEKTLKSRSLAKANVDRPVAVILGGQPGAGKSTMEDLIVDEQYGASPFKERTQARRNHSAREFVL